MESGKSSEASETRGVPGEQGDAPVKTASQLKKEAARQAKMEKFKKKQEQQAAMKDSQGEVWCEHEHVVSTWSAFVRLVTTIHEAKGLVMSLIL